jgi:hypothetical protein
MPTKILKRIAQPARTFHTLLRETLVYALGWGDVYANPAGNFTPMATGTDGVVSSLTPNRLTSATGPFVVGHVGKWLTVYNSEFSNVGVYEIIGVASATEVVLASGPYGAAFVDDMNVSFRVVDPTLNTGATEFVVQALAGSTAPLWQARFSMTAPSTDTIDIQVGPSAGWAAGWTLPSLSTRSIQADATQTWYALIDDSHIRMWTQTTAGTGVFNIAYVGAGEGRRLAVDDRFVVSSAGTPVLSAAGALADVRGLNAALATEVQYSALTYGDSVAANMFTSLPVNQFDLRNDSAKIPIGCNAAGNEEDDRGYLRGFRYISDSIPYRSFVDNGRLILSLGGGLAVEWDGSLSR